MKLTIQQIINLHTGLVGLDSYEKTVGDKVVKELYQLGGPFRMTVARNLNKLDAEMTAFRKARQALISQHTIDGTGKVNMMDFAKSETELLESEVEVNLMTFREKDLNLEKNPIPGTILSLILPVLEEP